MSNYGIIALMTREFNYETLTYEQRHTIHNALSETTVKHIDASGDLFAPMPFDLAASPSQKLEVVHLEPAKTTKEEVAFLANVANGPFSNFIKENLDKNKAFMSAARLMLNDGKNIFPVTNHGFIADVALWSEAWAQQLEEDHWQDQNGLVISRGVTTIQAFHMAASEVAQKIGHVFMSFPRTQTITNLGFDESLIDTNNDRMRKAAGKWLGERLVHRLRNHDIGKSLHVAWSGKTDSVRWGDNHKPESITMTKVTPGTVSLFRSGLVLPVVLWDGNEDEQIFELGELTKVETVDDAWRVQRWQAETLASRLGVSKESVKVN